MGTVVEGGGKVDGSLTVPLYIAVVELAARRAETTPAGWWCWVPANGDSVPSRPFAVLADIPYLDRPLYVCLIPRERGCPIGSGHSHSATHWQLARCGEQLPRTRIRLRQSFFATCTLYRS